MKHLLIIGLLYCLILSSFAETSGTLKFRLTGDPTTIDWNLAHASLDTYVIINIMEGLVEEGSDLKPKPALAEKWDISPDGKVYKFTLKPNVKWSDGRALRAQDFVDSWLRLLDPKTNSSYASFLFAIENAEKFHQGKLKDSGLVGIKALDATHLEVKLVQSIPYFLHIPTFWVTFPIRLDLIKKYGKQWTQPPHLVTLGPYQLEKWEKEKLITLKVNPAYYAPLAAGTPTRAEIQIVRDDEKSRELFKKGELNLFLDATTEDLIKSGSVGVKQYNYLSSYYLGFSLQNRLGKNPYLRKAISAAINRSEIPAILQGGQVAASGWVPPGITGHRNEPPQKDSLFEARGALVKAGYPEGRGLEKLNIWIENFDGSKKLAAYLTKYLRENVGIEIETHFGTTSEYQQAIKSGKVVAFVGHWGADFPDPANFFDVFVTGSGNNHTGWSNSQYDDWLAKARISLKEEERLELYKSAETLLTEKENVILPLFYRKNSILFGKSVENLEISPLNYLFLKSVILKK